MKQQDITRILLRAAAVLCCAFFPLACSQEETWTGAPENTQVQIAVDTRANGGKADNPELALYSLRVYAFIDKKLAGHYFTNQITGQSHSFNMDITRFNKEALSVNFYLVANEAAMTTQGAGAPAALSENTTEDQLNQYWFTDIKREELGLPMYCKETKTLDPAQSQSLTFLLKRPMGKLEVFAAKLQGETEPLKITSIKLKENGTRARNYLMPQSDETLNQIQGILGGLTLTHKTDEVTAVATQNDKDQSHYQSVMIPHYPYENPWGSNTWNAPGADDTEQKGHVMEISYQFGQEAERTGVVYLPPIKRNAYIRVNCLMMNEGKIEVNLQVADWDKADDIVLDFDYPTYDNPIMPMGAAPLPEGQQYKQPTIYVNADADATEGSYSFEFKMTGPKGQHWKPTLYDLPAEDFTIEVLQNGQLVSPDLDYGYPVSAEKYEIRIKALNNKHVDKTVGLGISYRPAWSHEAQLLLINGLTGKLKWEGSTYAEIINIKQTDVPTQQSKN